MEILGRGLHWWEFDLVGYFFFVGLQEFRFIWVFPTRNIEEGSERRERERGRELRRVIYIYFARRLMTRIRERSYLKKVTARCRERVKRRSNRLKKRENRHISDEERILHTSVLLFCSNFSPSLENKIDTRFFFY